METKAPRLWSPNATSAGFTYDKWDKFDDDEEPLVDAPPPPPPPPRRDGETTLATLVGAVAGGEFAQGEAVPLPSLAPGVPDLLAKATAFEHESESTRGLSRNSRTYFKRTALSQSTAANITRNGARTFRQSSGLVRSQVRWRTSRRRSDSRRITRSNPYRTRWRPRARRRRRPCWGSS